MTETREELEAALEAALAQRDEEERHKGLAIRQWMRAANERDTALAKLAAVRELCGEGDSVLAASILRALDGD